MNMQPVGSYNVNFGVPRSDLKDEYVVRITLSNNIGGEYEDSKYERFHIESSADEMEILANKILETVKTLREHIFSMKK